MTADLDVARTCSGLDEVPHLPEGAIALNRKDFTTGAEVRWCPGCGDYAILAAVQSFMPTLGISPDNIAVISGIGCSSRFPYYVNTYGVHSIHGRAPAFATGLATARPDLSVWVVTGDGDALSIGGNHLIHALRRNVNLTILLFNNRIYGLTKGQYSPTSEQGKITKSSPFGSVDRPFDPISVALGCEGTFVARTIDSDRAHFSEVMRRAVQHRGASLVEIYQNCPIFNDGAYDVLKDRDTSQHRLIRLEHGQPIRSADQGVVRDPDGNLRVIDLDPTGDVPPLVVHDAQADNPTQAFGLARLIDPVQNLVPIGIFRDVDRDVYDDSVRRQIADEETKAGGPATAQDLRELFGGHDTWAVG